MRCQKCGQDNSPGSLYCRFCGSKIKAPAVKKLSKPTPAKSKSTPTTGKKGAKKRRVRWGRVAILAFAVVVLAGFGFAGYESYIAWTTLPPMTSLVSLTTQSQDSTIYDQYGQKVATLHGSVNRINVPISAISPNMLHAIVAIEDHGFYTNPGFDLKSIVRAAIVDAVHRSAVQGASTITEQLAKDLYLSPKKTLQRKLQEFFIGLELARTYSKPQILDMYLNEVYFGNGASGIYAASESYFGEKPSQLTVAQASMLAGLPQAPSLYDPLINLKLAKERQLQVLNALAKYGYLTPSQAHEEYLAPLNFHPHQISASGASSFPYPWYIQHVITYLESKGLSYNTITNGGLKIYTALDPTVYNIAQKAVTYWMNYHFGNNQNLQAAVVVENPHNGYIEAVIGARQYTPFGEDLAISPTALRSSGSSIKPLMEYTAALVKGYTPMTPIQDVPIFHVNGHWWPHNDDHVYHGWVDLQDALAISDNDVAVHLLHDIGIHYGFNFATQKFGLKLPAIDANYLGMAIGGFKQGGVNAYEMTQAYATFPNGGVRMKPIWVTKIVNQDGAVIFQDNPQGQAEFSPQVAYVMDHMLEKVFDPNPIPAIVGGGAPGATATGYDLGIGRPAAGKTGTNNGEADAWFLGYEPQLTVGVWEGNVHGEYPQPPTLQGIYPYGDVGAGPIWQTIMEQVNKAENIPVEHFARPPGVVYVPNVSATSGLIASQYTPSRDIEGAWFVQGTQPTSVGQSHFPLKVVASNPNLLWQPGCGPFVTSVFLKKEPDWKPGAPLPADHIYWPPTQSCSPKTPPSSSSSTPPSTSSPSSPSPSPSASASASTSPSGSGTPIPPVVPTSPSNTPKSTPSSST